MQRSSDEPRIDSLPHVRGEGIDGQIELVHPGLRVEADDVVALVDVDPRQGVLPGCPGVRVGARWRRDNAEGQPVPWEQLGLRLAGIEQHRGRKWNAGDHATMRNVELQTWGIVEVNDRKLVVPEWMRTDVVDAPDGELVLTRNPRARQMIAWAWSAFEAGSGGCRLTRDQWAELLCCSPRSVFNYWRELEDKGLIRRVATFAPARYKGEIVPGSWDAAWIIRIGPELERIALAAFERPHVKYPRGLGLRRSHAHAVAVSLRRSIRTRGRTLQHELTDRRRRYAGLEAIDRESTSVATAVERTQERPPHRRLGPSAAECSDAGSAEPSEERRCRAPLRAAQPNPAVREDSTRQDLPTSPPLPLRGEGLGWAALRAEGLGTDALRSAPPSPRRNTPPPTVRASDAGDAPAFVPPPWQPTAEPERPASSPKARAAPGRGFGGRGSRESFTQAQSKLAEAFAAMGNQAAADAIRTALRGARSSSSDYVASSSSSIDELDDPT